MSLLNRLQERNSVLRNLLLNNGQLKNPFIQSNQQTQGSFGGFGGLGGSGGLGGFGGLGGSNSSFPLSIQKLPYLDDLKVDIKTNTPKDFFKSGGGDNSISGIGGLGDGAEKDPLAILIEGLNKGKTDLMKQYMESAGKLQSQNRIYENFSNFFQSPGKGMMLAADAAKTAGDRLKDVTNSIKYTGAGMRPLAFPSFKYFV